MKEDIIYNTIKNSKTVLFHSADASLLKTIEIEGLQPIFGDWRKELLSGACEDDLYQEVLSNKNNKITFFDLSPSWVSIKVSKKIKKPLNDLTWKDIEKHGLLAVIIPKDFDEDSFVKYGEKGIISSTNPEPVLTNLITGEKLFDDVPFGVEPGDVYSKEVIDPDYILKGKTLVNFLQKYYPNDNLLKENKIKKRNNLGI